ncbi:MAG: NUDIX domain-containing protein [Betaproteobacteria bacterium]
MRRRSAGLLMYRVRDGLLEVLLVHPGGPFWARKDEGAWSVPKGEYDDDEDALAAARREFDEETGFHAGPPFIALRPVRQRSGKVIAAWAFEGDCDPAQLVSNTFELEWPIKSGKTIAYPEVDRAAWFDLVEARRKINPGQASMLNELESLVAPPPALR